MCGCKPVEDYACLRQMDAHVTQNLHLIQPNLRDYTALLASGGIDYVGTRLHGGIHAMNMGCRSLILAVDNRRKRNREGHESARPAPRREFGCAGGANLFRMGDAN